MKRAVCVLPILCLLCLGSESAKPKAGKGSTAARPKTKPAVTSITGCIDQRDGGYVVTGDSDMKPIMKLRWDGDQDSMFARHMGHRVTVEGTLVTAENGSVMNVKQVKEVSDSCASAKEQ